MSYARLTFILTISLILYVSACGKDNTNKSDNRPDCYIDTDCPSGYFCTDGSCKIKQCENDSDCSSDMVCNLITYECETPQTHCSPIDDCVSDNDCFPTQSCIGCRCIDKSSICDPECSENEVCVQNTCVEDTPCDPECNPGMHCIEQDSEYVCVECVTNADCTDGKLCYQNSCQDESTLCNCMPGDVCDTTGDVPHCRPKECDTDADCMQGEICVNNLCESDPNYNCNIQCPLGYRCNNDTANCEPIPCNTDADCPQDMTCVNGICGF